MPAEETVVIGAGMAGLTAAVHLAERGVPVLLLEADSLYPGGRLWGGPPHPSPRPAGHPSPLSGATGAGEGGEGWGVGGQVTLTLNGLTHTFYPEHGIHGLWNDYQNLRAMLERFHITPDVTISQEEEWIHGEGGRVRRAEVGSAIHDSLLPPPLHYLNLFTRLDFLAMLGLRDWLALFSVWYSLLLAVALDPFARTIPLAGQNIAAFFRGWSPRLKALFIGLARSGLASTPEKISLAAFIASMRFYTLLRRDALRFTYMTTDPGTALVEPLVAAFRAREGELILGATADRLDPHPRPPLPESGRGPGDEAAGWRVRFQTRSGPRTFTAGHVILAVDPPAARRLLCESLATHAGVEKLTWPEGLLNGTVRLWFDAAPRPGPEGGIFTGDFVVDNFFWLHRIHRDFAEWAAATGGSALEMHLYRPNAFFDQPDAVILTQAIADVYRAFPELRGHLLEHALQRNAATQSQLIVDRPERWLGVRTPWPNLWACGDWVRGPWPALFIERACVSGLEAANAALQAMGLEPFPVMPYSEPEWLAGRIQEWLLAGRKWVRQWKVRRNNL